MKKMLFGIICLFFIPTFIYASNINFEMGEDVNQEKEVTGSSVIFGNNVTSNNKVSGIDMLFGNNISFEGNSDYGLFFGNNINIKGTINNDGFIFGNVINFEPNVIVNRDLVVFGSDVTINGKINRNLTIFASNVTINGEVLGNVEIKANEIKVEGKIAGVLSYNEDAIISISGDVNETNVTEKITTEVTFQDKLWQFITNYGSTLIIFLAFALLVPQLFKRIEKKNENITILNWFSLFGFGTLSIILIPVIFLMLLTLVFGLSLAILLLILYIIAIWLSSIFTSYLIGYLVWKKFIKKDMNMYLIGLIGISIISVATALPVFGVLVNVVSMMIGMGIILQQFKKDN